MLGLVPATVFFGPATVILLLGVIPHFFGGYDAPGIVALGAAGLGALVSLGLVVLAGPAWVRQRKVLRWVIVLFGMIGMVLTVSVLITLRRHCDLRLVIMLAGPLIVGLRYLPALLKRSG